MPPYHGVSLYTTLYIPPIHPGYTYHCTTGPVIANSVYGGGVTEPWAQERNISWVRASQAPQDLKSVSQGIPFCAELSALWENKL